MQVKRAGTFIFALRLRIVYYEIAAKAFLCRLPDNGKVIKAVHCAAANTNFQLENFGEFTKRRSQWNLPANSIDCGSVWALKGSVYEREKYHFDGQRIDCRRIVLGKDVLLEK